jgi:small subunit ribosomal protein S6
MRRYETVFIIDPDVAEAQRGSLFGRIDELIDQKSGLLIVTDDWGVRKLAYPIKKKIRGNYVRLEYCGEGALVDEIERFFRIDDRTLKYMTVVLDKNADLEKVKQEIAEAKEKAEAAEKATQQAAEAAKKATQQAAEAAKKATQQAAEAAPPEEVAEAAPPEVAEEKPPVAEAEEVAEKAEPETTESTDSAEEKEEA